MLCSLTMLHGPRKRVAVAMSGGVDSSAAAALLVEQGVDVVGVWMRLHDAADRVAPGGTLAYATCSILAEENAATAARP